MEHAATHIIHTSEGTVWVVTGSGLSKAALAGQRTNGAAVCLMVPGFPELRSGCAVLMDTT